MGREEGRVKRWVGEGGKATLVGARDAEILLKAIEELQKNTTSGAATFLVKVKAHRGEPAHEEANIQAGKAISGKDVPTEWHDKTNRAVFKWHLQNMRISLKTRIYSPKKSDHYKPSKKVRVLVYSGAKETTGDGDGRKYVNSQFSDQNRQDAISKVSAVQSSTRGLR